MHLIRKLGALVRRPEMTYVAIVALLAVSMWQQRRITQKRHAPQVVDVYSPDIDPVLSAPVSVHFEDVPLSAVVSAWAWETHRAFRVDPQEIETFGRVTADAAGPLPLGQALELFFPASSPRSLFAFVEPSATVKLMNFDDPSLTVTQTYEVGDLLKDESWKPLFSYDPVWSSESWVSNPSADPDFSRRLIGDKLIIKASQREQREFAATLKAMRAASE